MNIEGKRGEYKAKKGGEDERRKRKGEQKRTEKGGGFLHSVLKAPFCLSIVRLKGTDAERGGIVILPLSPQWR